MARRRGAVGLTSPAADSVLKVPRLHGRYPDRRRLLDSNETMAQPLDTRPGGCQQQAHPPHLALNIGLGGESNPGDENSAPVGAGTPMSPNPLFKRGGSEAPSVTGLQESSGAGSMASAPTFHQRMAGPGASDALAQLGLVRNPFCDRTAERAQLDPAALFVHSFMQDWCASEETTLVFGRRGSGKTTLRLQMLRAYGEKSSAARAGGASLGFLVADLSAPGEVSRRLEAFRDVAAVAQPGMPWDAAFAELWCEADLVDLVQSVAITAVAELLDAVGASSDRALALTRLRNHPAAARYLCVLAHTHALVDTAALGRLRALLTPIATRAGVTHDRLATASANASGLSSSRSAGARIAAAAAACAAPGSLAVAAAGGAALGLSKSSAADRAAYAAAAAAPLPSVMRRHPFASATVAAMATAAGVYALHSARQARSIRRAQALQAPVRVVRPAPAALVARALDGLFPSTDSPASIQALCLGSTTTDRLGRLRWAVECLGFEGLAVFGDCFDECSLLDPVAHPLAIRAFAARICRNDILSVGRQHWFLPDSRVNLDLSTERALREARFDRHFVLDLEWSRPQLLELGRRRFAAAALPGDIDGERAFERLFSLVDGTDFSGLIGQISTPRALLSVMGAIVSRVEAYPGARLTSRDIEIAVARARGQGSSLE